MTSRNKIADRLAKSKKLTQEKYEAFRRDLEFRGFVLPDSVRAHIESGGMKDSAATEQLLEWDGLFLDNDDYRGKDAASIIRTVPTFWDSVIDAVLPHEYNTDWQNRSRDYFVMRQWEDMWKSDAVPDSLLDLVRRYMIEFLPTITDAAPTVSDVVKRLPERPSLIVIFSMMRGIDSFKPEPLLTRNHPTLASVEAELQGLGVDYLRDLRSLPYPSELLSDPQWYEHDWYVCAECRYMGIAKRMKLCWSRGDVSYGMSIKPDGERTVMLAYCVACKSSLSEEPEPPDLVWQSLTKLGELVFQSIGQVPERTPDVSATLAYEYDLLPSQMDRLLRGEEAGDANPSGICPLASECPTFCGGRQREGLSERPFTRDGRWESCEYVGFRNNDLFGTLDENSSTDDVAAAVKIFRSVRQGDVVQAGLF